MLHVKRKLITEMIMFSSTDLAWVLNVPKRHSSKESYLKRLANLKRGQHRTRGRYTIAWQQEGRHRIKSLSQHLSVKINEMDTLNSPGKPEGQENVGIQQTLDQVCLIQECPEQYKTRTDPKTKLLGSLVHFCYEPSRELAKQLTDILSVCTYRIIYKYVNLYKCELYVKIHTKWLLKTTKM